MKFSRITTGLILWILPLLGFSQYQANNDATSLGGGYYRMTQASMNQNGSLWYKLMHNITEKLHVEGKLNFGTNDAGADGICFVLQNYCLTAGTTGGGIGYAKMPGNSIAVEFDTYQNISGTGNQDNHDPVFDHIAVEINGIVDHASPNNLFGPVQMDSLKANVEDGNWYDFTIDYDPATTTLEVYFNGYLRASLTYDIRANLFNKDPNVYWGFTSSTGGFFNVQQVYINNDKSSTSITDTTLCKGPSPVHVTLPSLDRFKGKNVALFKPTYASGNENGASSTMNIVDGDTLTRWSSPFSDPQWIYVDLLQNYDVDSVILFWETAYGKEYKIQVASDTSTWTDVYHTTNGNGHHDTIVFSSQGVRYVRMLGLQRATGYGYSLYEFQVYGIPKYFWSPNDGSIDDIFSATPVLTPQNTTSYTVVVPDACSGPINYTFTIYVNHPGAQPDLTVEPNQVVCEGDTLLLSTTSNANSIYHWFKGQDVIPGAASNSIKITTSGDYKVEVVNQLGCSDTSAGKNIVMNSRPSVPLITPYPSIAVCAPDNMHVKALSQPSGITYQWKDSGILVSGATDSILTINSLGTHLIQLIVSDGNGCTNNSGTSTVTINQNPQVELNIVKDVVCSGENVEWTGKVLQGSPSYVYSLIHSNANGSVDTVFAKKTSENAIDMHFSVPNGEHRYILFLKDSNGCSAYSNKDSIWVKGSQELAIPNLITPNGDASNDCLEIKDKNHVNVLPGANLHIYNRWGDKIFEVYEYDNNDTSGNHKFCGGNLADGIYYYDFETGCDNNHYKGWLEIIGNEIGKK
jgi:gliding motility-associated-like protein